MDFLPVFLNIKQRLVVVDGGGTIAARRVEAALKAGANVALYAREPGEELRALFSHSRLRHIARIPVADDFTNCIIAYGASGDPARDQLLVTAAHAAGALVNIADISEYCDFITPALVDRSPIVIAISSGGAAPIIARVLRARIEALIPPGYGRLAEFLGRFRKNVSDKIRGGDRRRHFWGKIIEGPVADLFLAGDSAAAQASLEKELANGPDNNNQRQTGEIYLVGAGPGDPDLLTFRALRLMQRADIVLYDRLAGEDILALVRRDAERINVGKHNGTHTMERGEISRLMIKLARQGKRVLRLKGGDPFLFGGGGEEIETLSAHGIPFQIVPGITAALGCAAYAGIPLTHSDHAQSCVFITAHGKNGELDLDWKALMRPAQTVVVYTGLANIEKLAVGFMEHGASPDMPAALIDSATRPGQQVIVGNLGDLAAKSKAAKLEGPLTIIIGEVVRLYPQLKWITSRREAAHKMSLHAQETL
ncbi:Precorrin-2 oxidase @ Sirohydrochlorin ferrochelatase activity of CysG / Uroporphyrinogen-III methyltransferase [hydrothermal vent metagenome]|uniref:Precorrin-2 oxidase @ Sirohydrochlorin ferrochelatase activity of CysG / Uroporphyrinogen-III methyltransferase n=1 Tax=hydrothermal vent metagenome TaxID=652676 RepID=A0A3B0TX76_9ZZZZ